MGHHCLDLCGLCMLSLSSGRLLNNRVTLQDLGALVTFSSSKQTGVSVLVLNVDSSPKSFQMKLDNCNPLNEGDIVWICLDNL